MRLDALTVSGDRMQPVDRSQARLAGNPIQDRNKAVSLCIIWPSQAVCRHWKFAYTDQNNWILDYPNVHIMLVSPHATQLGRQRKYPITRWDSNARPLDRETCPLSLCYDHSPSSIVRYISFSKRSKSGRTCNRLIMSTSELGFEQKIGFKLTKLKTPNSQLIISQ